MSVTETCTGRDAKTELDAAMPERPARAPNVRLVGAMPGTGFTEQQWLVQRGAEFVQLTELLYRVAECADGERTLEEIAQAVTASTEWIVDADGVQRIVQTKLLPLGLVTRADGSAVPLRAAAGPAAAHSPLALNLRMRILSPRIIAPIAQVLQVFHAPLVVLPVLIAAAVTHWWLYRVHGLEESLRDVLETPGGLPLVLAVLILAGLFHEFGHASALRYGGGEVRGMGVGFYLIYPAFYTDVTDSYRLGRWARVRTDLGGIYFHLIFAVGLMAVFAATGKELLLFAVLLINLEILYQFIPFVRLDGYWLLADLTGIPDFFSQMEPFLRSVLPVPRLRGSRLPNLRPWVRAIFALYILFTIPLLLYLFLLMLRALPRLFVMTGDALVTHARMFSTAWSQADLLSMVLLGISMLLLVLSVLGTLYILYGVSCVPIQALWRWSKPSVPRRMAGVLGAAAGIGLVAFLWAPEVRDLADRTHPVFRQSRQAMAKLQTLRAELEGTLGGDRFTGTVVLKRPNLAHIHIQGEGGLGEWLVVSDGANLFFYFPGDNCYGRSVPGADGRNVRAFAAEQIDHFFQPDRIGKSPAGGRCRYLGKEVVDGTPYDIVELTVDAPVSKTMRYFVSPADRLIHRVFTTTAGESGRPVTSWSTLKHIQTDVPVDDSAFQWAPPATAGRLQMPGGIALPLDGTPANTSESNVQAILK